MLERHLLRAEAPTDAYRKAAEIAPALLRCGDSWTFSDQLKGILIVGNSGAGKTTLAELLGLVYHIPRRRIFKVGELLRDIQGMKDSLGIVDRGVEVDKEIDSIQESIIRNAHDSEPFILEGRLANVWREEVAKEDVGIRMKVKSLLVAAPDDVAHLRLSNRAQGLSVEEVASITVGRGAWDANRWFSEAHPHLGQVNPYNPDSFDFIVDATKDIYDEFFTVHDWMKESGLIRPLIITRPTTPEEPETLR